MAEFDSHHRDILEEVSLRYGCKVSGFFVDGGRRCYAFGAPWEQLTRAMKAGNRDAIVAYNPWVYPKLTDFQDYWVGESGGALLPPPEASCFEEGGAQAGLQPHLNPLLDDPWAHYQPDTDIRAPLFGNEELIEYVRTCIAAKTVPSINMGITQDGMVSPATLEQMKALRRAIMGR